ncbi:DUF2789 domain-containing protein [Glaciecola sp. 2405UD65-10]|jgi:hypothetical protein|uniref:DUF2789 domain-containing protein n=1 Tax=Glaciecola sp. 2405UD65-10 TaxID=3397244 RepID=UPI003B58F3FE
MFIEQVSMTNLFGQLGLGSSDEAIETFIAEHKGLNKGQYLHEAPFWSNSQAAFLQGAIKEDADWAEVIDQLNLRLHK